MKKIAAIVLVLALMLSLTACMSEEAKAAVAAIDAIGEVTASSEEAILAARTAYDALTPEDQEKIENYAALEAAELALARLKFSDKVQPYCEAIDALKAVDDSLNSWIDTAWANAEVSIASIDGVMDGSTMDNFISNSELVVNADSYEFLEMLLDENSVHLLKLQNYAMHIGTAFPETFDEITKDVLLSGDAFNKNQQLCDLKAERDTLILPVVEEMPDVSEFADLLPDAAAAVETLKTAAQTYNSAVWDVAAYADLAAYRSACESAKAEFDAAVSAIDAIING